MHAVARIFSGSGARELFDRLAANTDDVRSKISDVPGFVSYTLFRTAEGGISVTVCNDKSGTDESSRRAAQWVEENASDLKVSPPDRKDGEVLLSF